MHPNTYILQLVLHFQLQATSHLFQQNRKHRHNSPHFFCIWALIGCSMCWVRKLGKESLICCKILRQKQNNSRFSDSEICYPLDFVGPPRLNRDRQSALVFFYWTTTAKLEFTDWSRVHSMFRCGENAIFRWGRMIAPRVKQG